MTKQVMTVLGPIAPEELGFTQTHEHLVLNLKRASHRLDALQNNESLIVEEVALPELRAAGVGEEQIQIMMVENPARLLPF